MCFQKNCIVRIKTIVIMFIFDFLNNRFDWITYKVFIAKILFFKNLEFIFDKK